MRFEVKRSGGTAPPGHIPPSLCDMTLTQPQGRALLAVTTSDGFFVCAFP